MDEDLNDPTKKPTPKQVRTRLETAEEVCWTLMLMMGLGGLQLSPGWRTFLGEPLQKWADLASEQGIMNEDGRKYSNDEFVALQQRVDDLQRAVTQHFMKEDQGE